MDPTRLFCLGLLFLFSALTATAQPPGRSPEQMKAMEDETIAALELDETQAASFREINRKYGEKMREMRDSATEWDIMREQLAIMRQDRDNEILALLDENQQMKYKEIQEERMKQMRENGWGQGQAQGQEQPKEKKKKKKKEKT